MALILHTVIKKEIRQSLVKNKIKTSNLPSKYQNWEQYLDKLTSKEQISNFAKEMNSEIERQGKAINQNSKPTSGNNDFPIGILIITLISLVGLVLIALLIRRKRKNRLK